MQVHTAVAVAVGIHNEWWRCVAVALFHFRSRWLFCVQQQFQYENNISITRLLVLFLFVRCQHCFLGRPLLLGSTCLALLPAMLGMGAGIHQSVPASTFQQSYPALIMFASGIQQIDPTVLPL